MSICLRLVEVIVRFCTEFTFVCTEERWYKQKLTQQWIPLFTANIMVLISTPYSQVTTMLISISELFCLY